MLNKAILVCVLLLVVLAVLQVVSAKNNSEIQGTPVGSSSIATNFDESGRVVNAQVSTWGSSVTVSPSGFSQLSSASVGMVWQRDSSQYTNHDEFLLWSPSACSVAATASVLAAFGHPAKISDVLAIMQAKGGISPRTGLSDYGNFGTVAQKYGLQATVDESHNLDTHFNSIVSQLRANQPVIVNVQDDTFFPSGHFVVAYRLNSDGSAAIMNPDPAPGKSVLQNWPLDGLKLYFSRTLRSITFTK